VNTVRTVSETKRSFYNLHTRPVNSIYRRVVEELMVEMHLLSVNVDFRYDPIYALGVVSSYNRFMQGCRPEADQTSIFNSLCQALQQDPQQYQRDAEQLIQWAKNTPPKQMLEQISHPETISQPEGFRERLQDIINQKQFKYSRLFGIGLFNLIEYADPELVKDDKQRVEALKLVSTLLHLPEEKLQKDLDLYRSNLEKMNQARIVMEDMLKADRKQREQRAQTKSGTEETPAPDQAASGS
jgi:photosystem II biogenesis protein Psp29